MWRKCTQVMWGDVVDQRKDDLLALNIALDPLYKTPLEQGLLLVTSRMLIARPIKGPRVYKHAQKACWTDKPSGPFTDN